MKRIQISEWVNKSKRTTDKQKYFLQFFVLLELLSFKRKLLLLIAASAIPGGYYCAPILLRLEEEYWRRPFLINFIGVIFEA